MTSEYKEKLQAYGVNLDSALNRFMDNEQFYERILSKFPMDENFILMERSLNGIIFPRLSDMPIH